MKTTIDIFDDVKHEYQEEGNVIVLVSANRYLVTYKQDARDVAFILGVTLTRRGLQGQVIDTACFPMEMIDSYLPRLISAGKRVAICEGY